MKMGRSLIIIGVLGATCLLVWKGFQPEVTHGADKEMRHDSRITGKPYPQIPRTRVSSPQTDSASREQLLQGFILRWREAGDRWRANRGKATEEDYRLAEETVALLLSSSELWELINSLEVYGPKNKLQYLLKQEAAKVFRSPRAVEARQALVDSNDAIFRQSSLFKGWLIEAACTCPPIELEGFRIGLGNATEVMTLVTIGESIGLAESDPTAAVSSLTNGLGDAEIDSQNVRNNLDRLIRNMPGDTQWSDLEASIPLSRTEDDTYSRLRGNVMARWGQQDPSSAVNHILQHANRFQPSNMSAAIYAYVVADPRGAFEWIQDIPSGSFFDASVRSVVPYVMESYPGESRELVSQVSDPSIRRQLNQYIDDAEKLMRQRLHQSRTSQ